MHITSHLQHIIFVCFDARHKLSALGHRRNNIAATCDEETRRYFYPTGFSSFMRKATFTRMIFLPEMVQQIVRLLQTMVTFRVILLPKEAMLR